MYKICALDLIDLKNDNIICILLVYAIKCLNFIEKPNILHQETLEAFVQRNKKLCANLQLLLSN